MNEHVKILIVDDEFYIRKTLSDILSFYGYKAFCAENGREAIKFVTDNMPDMVILDLILDDMSGLDILKEIKNIEPSIETILLTGNASQKSAIDAINFGVYGYMQKPFDADNLILMIKRAVEKQKIMRDLKYRLKLEEIITGISTAFINVSSHMIDREIKEALKTAGEFTGVERCHLYLYDNLTVTGGYEWDRTGMEHRIEELKGTDLSHYTWTVEKFKKGEYTIINNINDIPQEAYNEKEALLKRGIKSILSIPLLSHKNLMGSLGFTSFKEKNWKDEDINLLKMLGGIFIQLMERSKSEEALKESEKRYKTLFNSVNDPIFIRDFNGTFLEVNDIACQRLGYNREEFLTMAPKVIDPNYYLIASEIMEELKKKKQTSFESSHITGDGQVIPVEINSTVIDYKGKEVILSSVRDITRRKKAEENLIREKENLEQTGKELEIAYNELKSAQSRILQSEKMASIGQLAAGIAHEINNPIGFIGGNLRSLEKYINKFLEFMEAQSDVIKEFKTTPSIEELSGKRKKLKIDYITEDIKELIKESLDGTERVTKIVQDLKSFSRLDEGAALRHADINESIDRTLNIVWNEIKYKAKVIKEYGNIPKISCYPQQLTQVFMNLLVNASQAIEKEGEIFIKTWYENNSVCISIGDTGCGIKEEYLNKIFEPFFTTKEVGAGTGLGLSIIYDIIKKHKGDITVESTEGKGTVFTVKIPVEVSREK
ncbi:MAG: ATP-binding protein [Candidatus Eremiobacterota bacterium]